MFDDTYFTIRWRWLVTGFLTLAVCSLIIFGIHHWQTGRIGERLLSAARDSVAANDLSAAKRYYASCVQLMPDNFAVCEEYADVILSEPRSQSNDAAAMELLDKALQTGSTRIETRRELIRAAIRLKRFNSAAVLLSAIDLREAASPELYAMQGICSFRKGDYRGAEQAFRNALDIDAACAQAWTGLIELTESRDGLAEALKLAERMAQKVSGPQPHTVTAHLLTKSTNPTDAGQAFWDASQAAGQDFATASEFADFVMYNVPPASQSDLPMVQAAYDALSKTAEGADYMTAARLADLAHRLKQTDTALSHYQRCLEMKPGDAFAIGRTTEVLAAAGRIHEAHEVLDSMNSFASLKLLRNTLRAGLFAEERRFRDAANLLEDVVNTSGDLRLLEGATFLLVECLWEQQEFDRAAVVAENLLKRVNGKDDVRALVVEALIRSRKYEKVVKHLQLYRAPGRYLDDSLTALIEHARSSEQMVRLTKHIDRHGQLHPSSPLPKIFAGYRLADAEKTGEAVRSLAREAAENPDVPEYWSAAEALRDRYARAEFDQHSVLNLHQITDRTDRVAYLQRQLAQSTDDATLQLQAYFAAHTDSLEPLSTTHALFCCVSPDTEAASEVVSDLRPSLAAALNHHGAQAVPLVADIFLSAAHLDEAWQLLSSAIAVTDDDMVLQAFCTAMGRAERNSRFSPENIRAVLKAGNLQPGETVKEILLAEADAIGGDFDSSLQRLSQLLDQTPPSQMVVLSLLRISGYAGVAHADSSTHAHRLLKNHPDAPDVLFACSGAYRASKRYTESVRCLVRAFSINQDPEFLLHAAYSEWMADRTDLAGELLNLAQRAGLCRERLHILDRQLLDTLTSDPDLQAGTETRTAQL